ncbi:MAG: DUF2442 domain-containing protein [Bacteroidales bacterium]|nr:DUF2442 domain-containing protein [Bacteroidales bacterium]
MMEAKIKDVWFKDGRVFISTDKGEVLSRPLEAFPLLMEANAEERASYIIGRFGDDIRWPMIDEDIHISSFYRSGEPEYENEIGTLFRRFPQLNVSQCANAIGINKTLLSRYIYGIKKPSSERVNLIKDSLRKLGHQLASIK